MKIENSNSVKAVLIKLSQLSVKEHIVSKRNADIVEDILNGMHHEGVSKKYGLSQARLSQILNFVVRRLPIIVSLLTRKVVELEEKSKTDETEIAMLKQINADLMEDKSLLEKALSSARETEKAGINKEGEYDRKAFSLLISDMNFSRRTANVFRAVGIKNAGELITYKAYELLRFRDMGKKSVEEIRTVLSGYDLKLKGE